MRHDAQSAAPTQTEMTVPAPVKHNRIGLSPELEQARIITLQEAAKLSSISVDSWKRNHPDKIVRLSERRVGVRLADVLAIGKAS
jgi:hypothetical protein